jgi:C1A family cysteine protease
MKCFLKNYKTGFHRDLHDERDIYTKYSKIFDGDYYDLRYGNPLIFNQSSLDSSTANAVCILFKHVEQDETFIPSRLFLYYNSSDNKKLKTRSIRDTLKSIAKTGVCPENKWPYNVKKSKTKPDDVCYMHAYFHKSIRYSRIYQRADQLERSIALGNHFIVFGIQVFEYWKHVKENGKIRMPYPDDKALPPHTVVLCGFNKNTQMFIIQNSWGIEWGDRGFGYIPYSYILNRLLAWDFWIIQPTHRLRPIPESS